MVYTIPPDNRVAGNAGHIMDHNDIVDILTGNDFVFNALNTAFAGGADPTGASDSTAAIQDALNAASAEGKGWSSRRTPRCAAIPAQPGSAP